MTDPNIRPSEAPVDPDQPSITVTKGNPLTDAIPAKARKIAYEVVCVASFIYGVATAASQGAHSWREFVPAFIASISTALAHANTPSEDKS